MGETNSIKEISDAKDQSTINDDTMDLEQSIEVGQIVPLPDKCEVKRDGSALLLGIPNICSKYAQCIESGFTGNYYTSIIRQCPSGTLFDPAVSQTRCIFPTEKFRTDC